MRRFATQFLLALVLLCCVQAFGAVERNAVTFTRYDLQVSLDPAKQTMSVKGAVTVRNTSDVPLKELSLQISSSLTWQSLTIGGKPVQWLGQEYTSDIDHTGLLTEAIVTLPEALAPKATVTVEVEYSGTVPRNSGRLTRIGTPQDAALRADWDQAGEAFTAVRGVGYVTWYPVQMPAVSLSEGTSVFDTLAAWKQRHADTTLNVTIAVPAGLLVASNADSTTPGETPSHHFALSYRGFSHRVPTFAVAAYQVTERPAIIAMHLPEHTAQVRDYINAGEQVVPLVSDWFGPPRSKLRIIELADANAAPYDAGEFLFTPLRALEAAALQVTLAHQLVHTSFHSNRPWIEEGAAHLMQVLVRERQAGRTQALAYLDQFMPQLADIEKQVVAPSPNMPPQQQPKPQPLATTNDEFYYRSKAAFVWVMLRDLVGDDALKHAFAAYKPEQDTQPAYLQSLVDAPASPGAPSRNLEWFFDDWVYRDKGLPDFRVDSAYPRATVMKTYTVTVTVENAGTATAEVPVLVHSGAGEKLARVRVAPGQKAVARIPFPEQPTEAVVNDGSVPETSLGNNRFKMPKADSPQ